MKRLFLIFAIPTAFLLYGVALEAPMQLDDGPLLQSTKTLTVGMRAAGLSSFWITHQAFGLLGNILPWRPEFYHRFLNILIHALAATALFWLVKELSDNNRIAAIAGAIFLVHPIQTQAVTYISQRIEAQATMFMFAGASAYVTFRKTGLKKWLIVSLLSGALALLTKETTIVLTVWLMLIEICFFNATLRSLLRSRLIYFAAIAGVILVQAWIAMGGTIVNTFTWIPWYWYFASQGPVLLKYLQLCVWPSQQFLYYDFAPVQALSMMVVLQWLVVLAVAAVGLYHIRHNRLLGFGILSFFVLLLVVIILPLPDMIFEHRVYPAFAGLSIAVAATLGKINRRAATGLLAVILALLSVRTVMRNAQWNDELSFLELHQARFPDDPDILTRLGNYYFGRGAVRKAIEVTEQARRNEHRLNNYYSQARRVNIASNLVAMYLTVGDLDAASREAKRAVALNPREPFALRGLAAAQMARMEYAPARNTWGRFIAVRPQDPLGWFGLREANIHLGNTRGADIADAQFQRLQERGSVNTGTSLPRQYSPNHKLGVIFGLTIGLLVLVLIAFRTVWLAFNQRNLRMKPLADRPSS